MTTPFLGYTALLLHAHLPYVRQEQSPPTLEERWYYEAVTDTYLPLIEMLDRLLADGVHVQLTLSVSPTLLAMMEDPLMKQRTRQHLISMHELAQKEVLRLWGDADHMETAGHYAARFKRQLAMYDRLQGDLIAKLRSLHEHGCVELIPCAATHAFLPLVKNAEALRAQLEAAVTEFRRHFGHTPAGIWLPECGYTPAVEPHLQALGLRYFVVDAHTVGHAETSQAKACTWLPVRTPGGAAAFARDAEASTQVWSAKTGYPSDPEYREYYRDIGYDLGRDNEAEWQYIKPYVLPDGERIHTGLKYHRVTGDTDAKEPYHPERAARKAQQHAEHFLAARVEQLRRLAMDSPAAGELGSSFASSSLPPPSPPPIIVCPYDAELFGHWWYEGPIWLEAVLRGLGTNSHTPNRSLESITLSAYIKQYPPVTEAKLPQSSWGRGGYAEVWLQPKTDWIYPQLHAAEDRMIRAVRRYPTSSEPTCIQQRLLNQAAKELLLAQSSDWTFILDSDTVAEYAAQRLRTHLGQFHQLLDLVNHTVQTNDTASFSQNVHNDVVIAKLKQLEQQTPIFPTVQYTAFLPFSSTAAEQVPIQLQFKQNNKWMLNILMLTWEYPPRVIGGLSRAVYDLSRHLAAAGHEVHVITCYVEEAPSYELAEGVHVHRVPLLQSLTPVSFLDWVFQMNLAFIDYILKLAEQGHRFCLIHAHDWLVYYSAIESRNSLELPLVATIHATESGRNLNLLETDLQQNIHHMEYKLTNQADRIITCSQAMNTEVRQLFTLPEHKVVTIPNGVDTLPQPSSSMLDVCTPLQLALRHEERHKILCFMGRLVREKGVHILIDAMQMVWKHYPLTKLIIAGDGPMLEQLVEQAAPWEELIHFVGFLNETNKSFLLRRAELCVFPSLYEPFGIVALEAMICGTPVIVSDVGGLAEIIEHNVDGYKVAPGDSQALGEQIIEALLNPETSKRLAQSAAAKVLKHYHWTSIGTRTAEIYLSLTQPDIQREA
jgi:1,4-alpha-glucan branching enzyme